MVVETIMKLKVLEQIAKEEQNKFLLEELRNQRRKKVKKETNS